MDYKEQMKEWEKRQLEIVRLYDVEELTLQEIGDRYGISKQRVCQLYDKGIARLSREKAK